MRTAYIQASGSINQPVVLFGCGSLGRRTLAGLTSAGKAPVAVADNNPKMWGRDIDGTVVLSPADAVKAYGEEAVFAVTIYNGSAARDQLRLLGCRHVVHFGLLYQAFPGALMPHGGVAPPEAIFEHADEVMAASRIWADETSTEEYLGQMAWRLSLESGNLALPSPMTERYFPHELFDLNADDLFVDCGAFDGDSLRDLLSRRNGELRGFVGLEPDPENYKRLSVYVESLAVDLRGKVSVHPLAVGSRSGAIAFSATASPGSSISASGEITVECTSLDSLVGEAHPTFIKMDVEGNELDALAGARNVLEKDRPILAICLYHKPADLWQIPLFIKAVVPDYRLFMRRYAEDCWELVCYAVPESRLASRS